MSVEQIEATLLKLTRKERRQFAHWFYQHENEILEPRDDDEVSPEVKEEILRRRDEALAHPESLEPWDGTVERLRERLNEIRRRPEMLRARFQNGWVAQATGLYRLATRQTERQDAPFWLFRRKFATPFSVPVGGSPTGTGGSPVPPILKTRPKLFAEEDLERMIREGANAHAKKSSAGRR